VIGNPAFEPGGNAALPRLPAAEKEANAISALYPIAETLVGESATRARILGSMPASSVMHFGGHALVDESYPSSSALLVAGRGQDARISVSDIIGMNRRVPPVIVLGACSTGRGLTYRLEGVVSIARAFLMAGAVSVVASLWDVEDDAAGVLLESFHKHYVKGLPPSEALRRAQRELMTSTDERLRDPRAWSAFVVIGADAVRHPVEFPRTTISRWERGNDGELELGGGRRIRVALRGREAG
jgi:CHAT domain-containing protein